MCTPVGECERVTTLPGSPCTSELECSAGQVCQPGADHDGDGWVEASCVEESVGTTLGNPCESDTECRTGACVLGACTQLCRTNEAETDDDECPDPFACTAIPRLSRADGTTTFFRGCMRPQAQLVRHLQADQEGVVRIPVPAMTRSFAVIMEEDPALRERATTRSTRPRIGAAEVRAPRCDGPVSAGSKDCIDDLYASSRSATGNALRYQPAPEISTLLVPNTPSPNIALRPGVYTVRLLPDTSSQVRVLYKTAAARALDLNFYFLNLRDHKCLPGFEQPAMATPEGFETAYLDALRQILGETGLRIRNIYYENLVDDLGRSDLDSLRKEDLPELMRLSKPRPGINIFFVRSISPAGLQVLSGANPGPPNVSGTAASGIAVAADTLCYRSWDTVARATAHAIGLYMGLFRSFEPDGTEDPIEDSDKSRNNLMYFGDRGGTQLSEGQKQVLHLYPGLR